jgi:methane monooxygenase component A gamma chain
MSPSQTRRPVGASRQTEFPPFGNQDLRREWAARAAALSSLDDAVTALVDWRERHTGRPLTSSDALWIEARLEERVAVLRFEERSHDEIRHLTLTGEVVGDVCTTFERRAAQAEAAELERLAAEFRRRYKPPVMPSAAYLRTEVILSECLMKRRSLGWFEPSLEELRQRRGVIVRKEGLTEGAGLAPTPAPGGMTMGLQVEMIEESFHLIAPRASEFVAAFYERLFETSPEVKPLFASVNMADQHEKLVAALVLAVTNLRKPEALGPALREMGKRHVRYGVTAAHYPLVGAALLDTLATFVGSTWTTELKTAWADAYGAISSLMLEGAKRA